MKKIEKENEQSGSFSIHVNPEFEEGRRVQDFLESVISEVNDFPLSVGATKSNIGRLLITKVKITPKLIEELRKEILGPKNVEVWFEGRNIHARLEDRPMITYKAFSYDMMTSPPDEKQKEYYFNLVMDHNGNLKKSLYPVVKEALNSEDLGKGFVDQNILNLLLKNVMKTIDLDKFDGKEKKAKKAEKISRFVREIYIELDEMEYSSKDVEVPSIAHQEVSEGNSAEA